MGGVCARGVLVVCVGCVHAALPAVLVLRSLQRAWFHLQFEAVPSCASWLMPAGLLQTDFRVGLNEILV